VESQNPCGTIQLLDLVLFRQTAYLSKINIT